MSKRTLVWFRNDLRVHDHQPLFDAIQKSELVVPVYCIDPRLNVITEFGTKKTGSHRMKFLLESLLELKQNINYLNGTILKES